MGREDTSSFPFWEVQFDAGGNAVAGLAELLSEVPASDARDLFVFSHGWNNDRPRALRLYRRFFGEMLKLRGSPARIATVGVIWPSMRWIDEPDPEAPGSEGGAVGLTAGAPDDAEAVAALKAVFPGKEDVLDQLGALLRDRPREADEVKRFHGLLMQIVEPPADDAMIDDSQEHELLKAEPLKLFEHSARLAAGRRTRGARDEGGAAAFGGGDRFHRLWDGAKHALRQATYYEMKNRAGVVGSAGLGPLLLKLHGRAPDLRIHLIGHSFGARLASFSLLGLGDHPPRPSPIKSLLLLQGAFSHYAFARSLPHDKKRGGWLAGMQERVEGPVVVTHSVHDLAVGRAYPVASFASGSDAAAAEDWIKQLMKRWGAMGHDGAQAVEAAEAPLVPPPHDYGFRPGKFFNLNGDNVIKIGRPPSGAHSDIFHPHLAWVALTAAGISSR